MPEIVHNIDLSAIPHRPGQSVDLEAKRKRAWARLTDEEKEWVLIAWDLTGMIPSAPAFREMKNASDRVLYVLVGTEESLTPGELSYLMIARWLRNIDSATARAKMAQLVNQGLARYTGVGRTMAIEEGLEKLEDMARPPRRARDGESTYRSSDDRREPAAERRSSVGDYGAPRGARRDERDDRGGDSRGSRGEDGGGYSRGPRRDDRGGDSRDKGRDDRGGYSRGPRRDDRGGDSRDRGREDRGGYSRGPRRDDRGIDSRDRGREDRGGYSRGPRRDDRGGDSRGRGRNDRSRAPERGRINTDGPVIDGHDRHEQRVNTDGPIIDGRDNKPESSDE